MQPMLMMVVMIAVFYLIAVRPQAKRQREHQAMLAQLGADDVVVTRGGVIGRIAEVAGDVLVLEVQDRVRIPVPRAYVESRWTGAVPQAGQPAS